MSRAKEEIEKAYKNPNPYNGTLQDIMEAEIDYAKMCAICPCRKRRVEGEEEPAKKRKQVESETDGPAEENKEAGEDDEDSKSEVSLVIAEIDSDEEPEEDDPRDVEEERDARRLGARSRIA